MRIKNVLAATVLLVSVPLASACGGGNNTGTGGQAAAPGPATTAAPTPTATTAARRALTVRMSEFAFEPNAAVAKGGRVTITARNDGQVVHELVVLKTDADPAALPKKGAGVDESTRVGEVADVKPGTTKKTAIKLAPGKYAMVCALPGHYEGGMYGSLTVK
jgi:uncharacterized cupredoxin-like copper-binding protein